MKSRAISFLILTGWLSLTMLSSCQGQNPSSNLKTNSQLMPDNTETLSKFPIGDYVGKPAGELLDALPAKYDEMVYTDTGRPGILEGAQFRYGEQWLNLSLAELQHLTRFNDQYEWDFGLFRKETIAAVRWMD